MRPAPRFDALRSLRRSFWPLMHMHPQRQRLLQSRTRFDVVPCGRRSGKTSDAMHRLLLGNVHLGGSHRGCLTTRDVPEPTFVYGAPTHQQAMRIMWGRILRSLPSWAVGSPNKQEQCIHFPNGARLYVIGMDKPERVEGIPVDGFVLDEFADMREEVWSKTLRPAVATPGRWPGWGMFTGRPRGRNHFWRLTEKAKTSLGWDVFAWPSWVVMSQRDIDDARADLDERSFRQEFGGEFIDDVGQVYYQWSVGNLLAADYRPDAPLIIGLDFNRTPGVAVVAQPIDIVARLPYCPGCNIPDPGESGTHCGFCNALLPHDRGLHFIDEVWIAADSLTRIVCEELLRRYRGHRGPITFHGDATGGADGRSRNTSSERSDWAVVDDYFVRYCPTARIEVGKTNPLERDRVVMVNSKLCNASGVRRIMVDPRCKHLVQDFERVQVDQKTGAIDKKANRMLTHMSDAAGYLICSQLGWDRHGTLESEPL